MDINIAMIILVMVSTSMEQETKEAERQAYIGGSFVKKGQLPWHVVLSKKPNDDAICSGSLVSDMHILSVSSCLRELEKIYLRLGAVTLYDPEALLLESSTFIHHDDASVVLIVLADPIKFRRGIRPIALAKANNDISSDIKYRVSGYGLVWQPRPSIKKMEKTYRLKYGYIKPIIRLDLCSGEKNVYKMCARGSRRESGGICGGDKGSPVIGKNEWGQRAQIAIQMKYSYFCKFDDSSLTYVLLEQLLTWFTRITKIPIKMHFEPETSEEYDDYIDDYFFTP